MPVLTTYQGKPFTDIDFKAKVLAVGRELSRMRWDNMTGKQAEAWGVKRAKEKGVPPKYRSAVARGAMKMVIG